MILVLVPIMIVSAGWTIYIFTDSNDQAQFLNNRELQEIQALKALNLVDLLHHEIVDMTLWDHDSITVEGLSIREHFEDKLVGLKEL